MSKNFERCEAPIHAVDAEVFRHPELETVQFLHGAIIRYQTVTGNALK
jgi:hypothetical protein